jgi:hypothetical protein
MYSNKELPTDLTRKGAAPLPRGPKLKEVLMVFSTSFSMLNGMQSSFVFTLVQLFYIIWPIFPKCNGQAQQL